MGVVGKTTEQMALLAVFCVWLLGIVCSPISAFPYNGTGGSASPILSGGTPLVQGQDPTLADDKPDCGAKPVDEKVWKEERKNWSDSQFREEFHFNKMDAQFENSTRPNGGGAQFAFKCETCKTESTIPRSERACWSRTGGEGVVFFTSWLLPQDQFTLRELRAIESVLYHHPQATVLVMSNTLALDAFNSSSWLQNLTSSSTLSYSPSQVVNSFASLGCRVMVDRIHLREWAQGTPIEDWASKLQQWKEGPAYFEHIRETLKLLALYRFGGVVFDLDVVLANRVDVLTNSVGLEPSTDGLLLSTSVMVFQQIANPFILATMTKFGGFSSPTTSASFTMRAMTHVWYDLYQSPNNVVTVLSQKAFCPLTQPQVLESFIATRKELMLNANDDIRANSFGVKLWAGVTHSEQPMEGSVVAFVLDEFCLLC